MTPAEITALSTVVLDLLHANAPALNVDDMGVVLRTAASACEQQGRAEHQRTLMDLRERNLRTGRAP